MGLPLDSKTRWVAFLSNGETIIEGKGIAEKVPNELSPWHKLQEHLKKNSLKINALNIWVGNQHFNLPSITPKFAGEIPVSFNAFRRVESDAMTGGICEHYACVEAIYTDFKVQLYVDENDTDKCWVNISK